VDLKISRLWSLQPDFGGANELLHDGGILEKLEKVVASITQSLVLVLPQIVTLWKHIGTNFEAIHKESFQLRTLLAQNTEADANRPVYIFKKICKLSDSYFYFENVNDSRLIYNFFLKYKSNRVSSNLYFCESDDTIRFKKILIEWYSI